MLEKKTFWNDHASFSSHKTGNLIKFDNQAASRSETAVKTFSSKMFSLCKIFSFLLADNKISFAVRFFLRVEKHKLT